MSIDRPIICFSDFHNEVAPSEVLAALQKKRAELQRSFAAVISQVHDVERFSIHDGAFHARQLGRAWGFLNPVCVGIVDPGVGTDRNAIALETERAGVFVGPNNGIFQLAMEEFGVQNVVEIDPALRTIPRDTSNTFDGRDLFAPAAAHLSAGARLRDIGSDISPSDLVDPQFQSGDILHFCGLNNAKLHDFHEAFAHTRSTLSFVLAGRESEQPLEATKVSTFGEARDEQLVMYQGSSRMIEFAKVGGSIRETLLASPGDRIIPLL